LFDKDPVVWPANHSYLGVSAPWAPAPLDKGRLGVGSKAFEAAVNGDPVSVQTAIQGEENGALFVTLRARQAGRGKVVSFTSLPSGKSVYMERVEGGGAAMLGGMIALLEEPEWVYGRAARSIQRDGDRWVNVDGWLGYAMSGNGTVEIVPDLRSRLLFLNKSPRSGAIAVIVTLPGASAAETRQFASRPFRLRVREEGVAAVEADGLLIVTNTTPHPLTAHIECAAGVLAVPVNGISTRVKKEPSAPPASGQSRSGMP